MLGRIRRTFHRGARFLAPFLRAGRKGTYIRTHARALLRAEGREMETLIYLTPYNWSVRVKQDLMVL